MKLELQIGSKILKKDGQPIEMDVVPFTQDNRTFVPIRFVAENLGYDVSWDDSTQTVVITDEKPSKHKKYYDTEKDCAYDFAMCYNNLSIGVDRELSAIISEDDKGQYYWENVYMGANKQTIFKWQGTRRVAMIHSHAAMGGGLPQDRFSSDDKRIANKYNCPLYLIAPCGVLMKYTPNGEGGVTEVIASGLPLDIRYIDKCEKFYPNSKECVNIFNEYFGDVLPELIVPEGTYNKDLLDKANYYNEQFRKVIL